MLSAQWHVSVRIFMKAKNQIWDFILSQPYGCTVVQIMSATGYSRQMVIACTDELCDEERVGLDKNGRFHPENDQ